MSKHRSSGSKSDKVVHMDALMKPSKLYSSCYESHPILELGKGKLLGGNCDRPVTDDADVYIGLQSGMRQTSNSWPWSKKVEFLYPIQDMGIPNSAKSFHSLVSYICKCLKEGKFVHVGCIGGHGRTGMVFAAVVKEMLGEEDAITWVRKNYCHKAVESSAQVRFLHEEFGIKKVSGSKSDRISGPPMKTSNGSSYSSYESHDPWKGQLKGGYAGYSSSIDKPVNPNQKQLDYGDKTAKTVQPIESKRDIWKKTLATAQ